MLNDFDFDSNGDIYAVGTFSHTEEFGETIITSLASHDGYIVKISEEGEWGAVKTFSSSYDFSLEKVSVNNVGNIAIAGHFSDSTMECDDLSISNNDDNGGLNNLLNSLDDKYPASFLIAYNSQSEDGEQLDVPELDKVIESANKIDLDNSVEDLSQGIYRVTLKNFLPVSEEKNTRFLDQEKVQEFVEPFNEIGNVFQVSISG